MIRPGDRIAGRYRIDCTVATGGEACVFKARDLDQGREVAVKVRSTPETHPLGTEEPTLPQLAPQQNLPVIYDELVANGHHIVVMEWVPGDSLEDVVANDGSPGLPIEEVCTYVGQAAEALAHLHAHTPPVVHGDVKPPNLIRTPEGNVLLVDFGSATRPGRRRTCLGTPGYLAPEVAAGHQRTPAADVYGLAATTLALLTGLPPAVGMSITLPQVESDVAALVVPAVEAGMAIVPSQRPTDPRSFFHILDKAAASGC